MSSDFNTSATIRPIDGAAAITPSDTVNLTRGITRGLYVGVSGDVKVDLANGDTVTFVSLIGGIIHPLRVIRVYTTDTTATSILGVY